MTDPVQWRWEMANLRATALSLRNLARSPEMTEVYDMILWLSFLVAELGGTHEASNAGANGTDANRADPENAGR